MALRQKCLGAFLLKYIIMTNIISDVIIDGGRVCIS